MRRPKCGQFFHTYNTFPHFHAKFTFLPIYSLHLYRKNIAYTTPSMPDYRAITYFETNFDLLF
jgi:hypothetical protein